MERGKCKGSLEGLVKACGGAEEAFVREGTQMAFRVSSGSIAGSLVRKAGLWSSELQDCLSQVKVICES